MGFLAPAMPYIIQGASALGGWFAGRKAQQAAMQRSPEETAALQAATGAGQSLLSQGQRFQQLGLPGVQAGMGYWDTLLRGNRAAMSQATAGPRAAITDQYAGAARGLERSGLRGAVKDLATANLSRDLAGKVAGLTTGVQPEAAQQLAGLGGGLISAGGQQLGAAGGLFSGLLGQGYQNRVYARNEGAQTGAGIGSLLFDVLSSGFGRRTPRPIVSPYGGGGAGDQGPNPNWRF